MKIKVNQKNEYFFDYTPPPYIGSQKKTHFFPYIYYIYNLKYYEAAKRRSRVAAK